MEATEATTAKTLTEGSIVFGQAHGDQLLVETLTRYSDGDVRVIYHNGRSDIFPANAPVTVIV